jgi:uncharacterized protein (DUF1800 family)
MSTLISSRRYRLAVLAAVGFAVLSQTPVPASAPLLPSDDASIVHALERLTFGARPEDIARARRIGLAAWIDGQLQPSRIDDHALDARLAASKTLQLSSEDIARDYFLPARAERRQRMRQSPGTTDGQPMVEGALRPEGPDVSPRQPSEAQRNQQRVLLELSEAKILRAVYGERQLEEVLVDFWFNHFNVFAGKGLTRAYVTEYEREAIRPHVLGTFRDLLGATAKSPAMLFYLDNWMSSAPGVERATGSRPLGSPSGTRPVRRSRGTDERAAGAALRRSSGLNENYARELLELHTLGVDGGYTQEDIVNVARAFTGWTIDRPGRGGFRFASSMHDAGEKTVLGQTIKPGGGQDDGERVLDIIAAHPSTARSIAAKVARRFVSDEPPQALVDRAAARFRATGGNLREVVRVIVTSPEFFEPAARAAKVKTPFEFVASALRATGANVENGIPLVRALRDLGMPVYFCQPPTGYDDTADAWVSSGALVNRMNFALELAGGRLRGVTVDTGDSPGLQARLARDVLHDRAAASTLETIDRAPSSSQALALAIGSPEFQRR